MSINNTNIKQEYLDDNSDGYDDDVDTIEADDQMDYTEEVLMEGNIMTGAVTIYPAEFIRQQELRQKTVVTPRNKPQIAIIGERQPRPALVQRGPVNNTNLTAIPINQLPFSPQNRAPPPIPAIYKGSISVPPKNNVIDIKFNIDSLPLLQSYPVGYSSNPLPGFKHGDIINRINQQTKKIEKIFVPGTFGWITRPFNEFEMILLVNDFITILSSLNVTFDTKTVELSKSKFLVQAILINYTTNELNGKMTCLINGEKSIVDLNPTVLPRICDRMMSRLITLPPNTKIFNSVDVLKNILLNPSWAKPRIIEIKACLIVFGDNQKYFHIRYKSIVEEDNGNRKLTDFTINLNNIVSVAIVIGAFVTLIPVVPSNRNQKNSLFY
jgi:hypothetical protein